MGNNGASTVTKLRQGPKLGKYFVGFLEDLNTECPRILDLDKTVLHEIHVNRTFLYLHVH